MQHYYLLQRYCSLNNFIYIQLKCEYNKNLATDATCVLGVQSGQEGRVVFSPILRLWLAAIALGLCDCRYLLVRVIAANFLQLSSQGGCVNELLQSSALLVPSVENFDSLPIPAATLLFSKQFFFSVKQQVQCYSNVTIDQVQSQHVNYSNASYYSHNIRK